MLTNSGLTHLVFLVKPYHDCCKVFACLQSMELELFVFCSTVLTVCSTFLFTGLGFYYHPNIGYLSDANQKCSQDCKDSTHSHTLTTGFIAQGRRIPLVSQLNIAQGRRIHLISQLDSQDRCFHPLSG